MDLSHLSSRNEGNNPEIKAGAVISFSKRDIQMFGRNVDWLKIAMVDLLIHSTWKSNSGINIADCFYYLKQ